MKPKRNRRRSMIFHMMQHEKIEKHNPMRVQRQNKQRNSSVQINSMFVYFK